MTQHGVVHHTETRVVDPLTGGEKGSKIERFDLIPEEMETGLARHYGEGAKKYADRNWEKGYKWGLSYAALRRHYGCLG
jgi:glutamine cyclotransferase